MSSLHPTFQEPDIQIDDTILDLWRHDQLANAEKLLNPRNPRILPGNRSHALASRALVRARLRQWDAAIADTTAVCVAPLSHALSLILHQVYQNPAIRHWLHRKECSACR